MTERTGASPWVQTSSMTSASSSCSGGGGAFFFVFRAGIRRIVGGAGSGAKLGRPSPVQDRGESGRAFDRTEQLEPLVRRGRDAGEPLHPQPPPSGVGVE